MIYGLKRERNFLFADDISATERELTLEGGEKMILIFCASEDIKVGKHVQLAGLTMTQSSLP